jgi:DNA-binding MarR family transcriptional regulator
MQVDRPMKKTKQTAPERFDPGRFELESFLPYRLSLLTNTISQGIAASYREHHDISVTEWRVMAVLGRFPGSPASEVAERTAMDKVAISRAVKSLEAKGLLQRKTDPGDRRRQSLYITEKSGQAVLEEVVPLARQYESQLTGVLSEAELRRLDTLMNKLQARAIELNSG